MNIEVMPVSAGVNLNIFFMLLKCGGWGLESTGKKNGTIPKSSYFGNYRIQRFSGFMPMLIEIVANHC